MENIEVLPKKLFVQSNKLSKEFVAKFYIFNMIKSRHRYVEIAGKFDEIAMH